MRGSARPSRRARKAVIFAAGAVVVLRAAARRPQPRGILGTQPAPASATAEDGPAHPAVIAVVHHTGGQKGTKPAGTLGRPDGSAEQMQHVFHELHAEGRHALCEVCANQYRQ
jgi:hypothetical protein